MVTLIPREPLSGGGALNACELRKIRSFQPISRYMLDTVHDKPVFTMER